MFDCQLFFHAQNKLFIRAPLARVPLYPPLRGPGNKKQQMLCFCALLLLFFTLNSAVFVSGGAGYPYYATDHAMSALITS